MWLVLKYNGCIEVLRTQKPKLFTPDGTPEGETRQDIRWSDAASIWAGLIQYHTKSKSKAFTYAKMLEVMESEGT